MRFVRVAVAVLLLGLPAPPALPAEPAGAAWSFPRGSLAEVLVAVRDRAAVALVVDWAELERAGVGPETPVSLELSRVSPRIVLELALRVASSEAGLPPADGLGFAVRDGVVEVSTRARLAETTPTWSVYPVRDLLMEVPDFDDAPRLHLRAALPGGRR